MIVVGVVPEAEGMNAPVNRKYEFWQHLIEINVNRILVVKILKETKTIKVNYAEVFLW